MKKRFIVNLLILSLLCGIGQTALAHSEPLNNTAWCTDGEHIFAMEGDVLTVRAPENLTSWEPLFPIGDCLALRWREGDLWAAQSEYGGALVRRFGQDGAVKGQWHMEQSEGIRSFAVTAGHIVCLIPGRGDQYDPTASNALRVFDRESGASVRYELPPGTFGLCVDVGGDDYVYLCADVQRGAGEMAGVCFMLDPMTGALEPAREFVIDTGNGFACFGEDAFVYLYSPQGLYRGSFGNDDVSLEWQEPLTVRTPSDVAGIGLVNGWYVLRRNDGTFLAREDRASSETLCLVNASAGYPQDLVKACADYLWNERHVNVRYVAKPYEQLKVALMAMDEDMDVIAYGSLFDQETFMRANILEDLGMYPEIMENLTSWRDLSAYADDEDGTLRGIPMDTAPVYALCPEDALEAPVTFASWEEFLDFARDTQARTGRPILAQRKGRPIALDQYLALQGSDLRFDTPLFRELMPLMRAAFAEGLFVDWVEEPEKARQALYEEVMDPAWFSEDCILLPGLDNGAVYPDTNADLVGLLKFSCHKEAGAAFLAALTSPEVQNSRRYDRSSFLLKDWSGYDRSLEPWEQEMYGAERLPALSAPLEARLRDEVFPNARPVRLMGVEFLDGMFALVEDYMNGEMELDALVDRLDSLYDMMLMG